MKYVFIHGLGQSSSSFDTLKSHLDFDIITPNLFEISDTNEINFERLYRDFEKYLLGIDGKLHLCGLSLGGILAIKFASAHPEKVNSLILIGALVKVPKFLFLVQNIVMNLIPTSKFNIEGFDKKSMLSLLKSMQGLDLSEDTSKFSCKTLVLCGENDKANKKSAIELKKKIKNSELIFIENSGHEVNVDNPKGLGEILDKWLNK